MVSKLNSVSPTMVEFMNVNLKEKREISYGDAVWAVSKMSAGGINESPERPGTLKTTSCIVQSSSILVLVCSIDVSPNRKTVATVLPW